MQNSQPLHPGSADPLALHFNCVIDSNANDWKAAMVWYRANWDNLHTPEIDGEESPFGGILGNEEKMPNWAIFYGKLGTGRKVCGICKAWRKRLKASGFEAGEKLAVVVLAKSMIMPCDMCEADRGVGWTCWGISMPGHGKRVIPKVWYAKNGAKFDVNDANHEDQMKCTCGGDETAEFQKGEGYLILLTPCALLSGLNGIEEDRTNAFELKVQWREGVHWAPLAADRVVSAHVVDDGGRIGETLRTMESLRNNVCRVIFADHHMNRKILLPLLVHNGTMRKSDCMNCFDTVTGELVGGEGAARELQFGPLKRNIEGTMQNICCGLNLDETCQLMVAKKRLCGTMGAMLSWHHLLSSRNVDQSDLVTYSLDNGALGNGERSLSRAFFSRFAEGVLHALDQCDIIMRERKPP